MTIVQLVGANGSGKTTVVRELMSEFTDRTAFHMPGRRLPSHYRLERLGWPVVYVVGHYEGVNGGGDTFRDWGTVEMLVRQLAPLGSVLLEGPTGREHLIGQALVWLQVPLETCKARVTSRGHRISMERIVAADRRCQRMVREHGRATIVHDNASARAAIKNLIKKGPPL